MRVRFGARVAAVRFFGVFADCAASALAAELPGLGWLPAFFTEAFLSAAIELTCYCDTCAVPKTEPNLEVAASPQRPDALACTFRMLAGKSKGAIRIVSLNRIDYR